MGEDRNNGSSWVQVATQRPVVVRSVKVALLVGTILVGINHGNVLLGSGVSSDLLLSDLYWKVPLTYLVPYSVSTYAAVDAILTRQLN